MGCADPPVLVKVGGRCAPHQCPRFNFKKPVSVQERECRSDGEGRGGVAGRLIKVSAIGCSGTDGCSNVPFELASAVARVTLVRTVEVAVGGRG